MSRFDPFTPVDLCYHMVDNHALEATLFIPTHLASRPRCSVLVHFHGGGFLMGHRRYEPWFAQWFLDLARAHEAIIIRPDYRLLPESSVGDILQDIDQFWRWMQRDLPSIMAHKYPELGVLPDLSRVLCCGESSGGCLAVYSALELDSILPTGEKAGCPKVTIQAAISTYAPLDPDVPKLRIPRPRTFMGIRPPPPRQAETIIKKYMQTCSQHLGAIRSRQEPTPEMWEVFLCMVQQCYFTRLLKRTDGGTHGVNMVERMMAKAKEQQATVPTWIIHGRNDTLAPFQCAVNYVQRMKEVSPSTPIRLDLLPGDHLFDVDMTADDEWIAEGRRVFLHNYWP
ncbi:alpha/beta-hydrolase [Aspergillus indologenus CBS 114.80]|uniref:Alpha/beta-hydrolase n=1 Tax=Aspergillus indologenus CBS 114.80 TaxID=1450541 RepID=A0A2V5IH15_9EURO|nr:alpha/beta-hydrolase [Aspergillus indologenus CBS 114.80]